MPRPRAALLALPLLLGSSRGCDWDCDCDGATAITEEATELAEEAERGMTEWSREDLPAIDPVAHAWIRAQPEIVAAAGDPISRIEHYTTRQLYSNLRGTSRGAFAREVGYRVTGAAATVTVYVTAVRGNHDTWTVPAGRYLDGAGEHRLGDVEALFVPPPEPPPPEPSTGGGGGGFDWD